MIMTVAAMMTTMAMITISGDGDDDEGRLPTLLLRSAQDFDLSHPEFFRGAKFAPNKPGAKQAPAAPAQKDQGQPGCTDREREGFAELLERGGLVVRAERDRPGPAAAVAPS